ncbi:DUF397 domain-containing protein [Nocardiopsis lambiniae]|uniref:DUF397 domain-containing protein n=1 Tax=Nocardiopsis lambiniae TaxID=3075539 RepID=A0ABU2M7S2_9ACTN|nr:DUF397 domain-containing protein [Nocardiopsis sp. DSM 44743]MDT0328709.1 DUF397 domain-containing protein [Nocardiopsis sp. DSM 44743]
MNRDTSTVTGWRTSSYSTSTGGNCVEIGWHINSYGSDSDVQRVEAGPFLNKSQKFAVRDSSRRELGHLSFPSSEWAALLRSAR